MLEKKRAKKKEEEALKEKRLEKAETLEKLCDTILWLHEGKIKMQGSTGEVLPLYNDYMS